MSIQFNYFATESDTHTLSEVVLDYLGDSKWLPDRVARSKMVPSKLTREVICNTREIENKIFLIPQSSIGSIVFRDISNHLVRPDYQMFSCVEYCPSFVDENLICSQGRLAYFYIGDDEFKKQVHKMYRRLKKLAQRVPGWSTGFWIFPDAAERARHLINVGRAFPNPLYQCD